MTATFDQCSQRTDSVIRTDEIDRLIDDTRRSTFTHEENLELFYQQFERRADVELCEDCALAVLDAAVD